MSDLDDSFAKLLGRQPNDKERQNLYRVRDALGLKNNDAIWLVLMALQHHHSLYEQFPEAIAQAATDVLGDVKKTAGIALEASTEAAKADMAKAVSDIAQKVADSTAHKKRAPWIAICAVVVALTFGGGFWYAHSSGLNSGYQAGYGAGYTEAKDEKAAASWANTPEGQKAYKLAQEGIINTAYKLAQTGTISKISRCDQPGWYIEDGACYVKSAPDGNLYGWQLP